MTARGVGQNRLAGAAHDARRAPAAKRTSTPESAPRAGFDAEAFFAALDSERVGRRLNWKQVAAESGVSASTLTRLGQGKRPDVDSLAALVSWAGLNADTFVRRAQQDRGRQPTGLTMISTYLRADKNLSAEQADMLDELVRVTYERLAGKR